MSLKIDDPSPRPAPLSRLGRRAFRLLPMLAAVGCVAGFVYMGQKLNWSMPKYDALFGAKEAEKDDWCEEHSVRASICVECVKELMPKPASFGWCTKHGLHECSLCNPSVAQTQSPAVVTDQDRARADRCLSFAPRGENNSKCGLHERRVQLEDEEIIASLGIEYAVVSRAAIRETATAPGEITHDPTRIARVASRVPGTIWRVFKQVGDRVDQGEVIALIDAADVGRAKAEFLQAVAGEQSKSRSLARLRELDGASVSVRTEQETALALEEARMRLLTARQALANLGFAIPIVMDRDPPSDLVHRMQFLGIPESMSKELQSATTSSNLIGLVAPFAGEVVTRSCSVGEAAEAGTPLFVVADTNRMRLVLHARLEDAPRIRQGQRVEFEDAGHEAKDIGQVAWISPEVDEKSRTVPIRVELATPSRKHQANTFGTGMVILREEPYAIVIPRDAVHWDGSCQIVFVRDRDFDKPKGYKVFHVREVRTGAQEMIDGRQMVEIAVGLLPGEMIATAQSGILRGELLKNNLGEG